MSNERISKLVIDFLISEGRMAAGEHRELDASTDLFESGILDSMAVLELLQFLEEEFGVKLEGRRITADSVRSLNNIADLVSSSPA
jgi:acyl carrier protein